MHSHVDFASSWDAFTCSLPKLVLNRCFLESVLIKIFTIFNFGNTLAMSIMFYFKMFKIWCRIKKWNKKLRKIFGFADNCIWIQSCKFSQPWTGYLPSEVNVWTSTPKISPHTGWDIFQINLNEIDKKTS